MGFFLTTSTEDDDGQVLIKVRSCSSEKEAVDLAANIDDLGEAFFIEGDGVTIRVEDAQQIIPNGVIVAVGDDEDEDVDDDDEDDDVEER